jgi:hypothetical protein
MTTNLGRESAKIYQFPTRASLGGTGLRGKTKPAADLKMVQLPEASFGSGWYHEAAIRDADRNQKI